MTNAPGNLEQLGAALKAGDPDAVMSCFAADAVLGVVSNEERITLTGAEIGEAVDMLLTGFDDLRMTPTSRVVSKERVVEEAVLSGGHTGVFAGAEPTRHRVHVNLRLSATWGAEATFQSLWVEADTRALFSQIAGNNDVVGATGGLMAMARERHEGALHVTDQTKPPPTRAASRKARPTIFRSRWVGAVAVAATLLVAAVTWRTATATPGRDVAQAAVIVASRRPTPTPTPTRSARVAPRPSPKPQPKPAAAPVIATANPKTALHVQAGKQVVLNSDVLFAFDSAALAPAATAALTRLAQQLRATNVAGTIQINGYTDNKGSLAYDSALSRSRALAVARVLQKALVGRPVTLVPQGFGQANPIAPNTSPAGQARNRRVTIVLPVHR